MSAEGTSVVLQQGILLGSAEGPLQKVAIVYMKGQEYRVLAPPNAGGDLLESPENLSVRQLDTLGAETEVNESDRASVIGAVKDELERSRKKAAELIKIEPRTRYYHVRLHTPGDPSIEVKFDLGREELVKRVLDPYRNLRPIVLGGRTIRVQEVQRIEVYETSYPSSKFGAFTPELARNTARSDWHYSEEGIKDVTDELVTTPSIAMLPQKSDAVELLCDRFHTVAKQLRSRHENRPTLDIADEYDVQDLLHALLRIFFDDVRPEEYTPSYAGKSSKMDFLIPTDRLVVEAKKTRPGLGAKELGSELIEDMARYKVHPSCEQLICFVYDPEGRIVNPRGIENDLSGNKGGIEVRVIIAP